MQGFIYFAPVVALSGHHDFQQSTLTLPCYVILGTVSQCLILYLIVLYQYLMLSIRSICTRTFKIVHHDCWHLCLYEASVPT